MTRAPAAALVLVVAACVHGPGTPAPMAAIPVHAPVAATWDAAIDAFAAENIPIKTMDRSSGYIATDEMDVSGEWKRYADCGTTLAGARPPFWVVYNVRVKGDSSRSSIEVTARWTRTGDPFRHEPRILECSTRGVFEGELATLIRDRAEHAPAVAGP